MAKLEISLFGQFRVLLSGVPVTTFESVKVRLLLAYLATEHERPHSRESLAALLWPDWPQQSAMRNLRNALADLRQNLGDRQAQPPFLLVTRDSLQLNREADLWVDVIEFEQGAGGNAQGINDRGKGVRGGDRESAIDDQRSAISDQRTATRDLQSEISDLKSKISNLQSKIDLYRGPFLDGFPVTDSPQFEEWVLAKREYFSQQVLKTLGRLAEWSLEQGEYEQAEGYARRQIELEPWCETAYQQFMTALSLRGERVQALAQFENLKKALQRELKIEPSEDTLALYQQIRDGKIQGIGDKGKGEQGIAISDQRLEAVSQQSKIYNPQPTIHNNLPLQLTSFIGRGKEIEAVTQLLGTNRLVTLCGAGGTGKTRLALRVAEEALEGYPDGVWLVELAPLSDPQRVASTLAHVLEVSETGSRPIQEVLVQRLRSQQALLVLDNCEHLVDACARLAQALLQGCPQVHILATSREALGVPGERLLRVPSLAVPDPRDLPGMDRLPGYDAVRLFVERAASALTDFHLTLENAPQVAQICWRLDGIPLAIELAAAWVKVLRVEQIASRLEDAFRLLTGGARTALPRQQTLQASVDWSYNLLSEGEQRLLGQLSVFAGGWRLEAAEAVCTAGGNILELLIRLVDKSLIQTGNEVAGMYRFHLLEIIRQYAHQKLLALGEEAVLHSRHMVYYAALVEQAGPLLRGPQQVEWQDRMEEEVDNLRQALEWAAKRDVYTGLSMAATLHYFWHIRGRGLEGVAWLERLLALEAEQRGEQALIPVQMLSRGNAINSYIHLFGDYRTIQGHPHRDDMLGEALGLFLELGEQGYCGAAYSLQLLGRAEEALELSRRAGDRFRESQVLMMLWEKAYLAGDLAKGLSFSEQQLTISRSLGDLDGIGAGLSSLGLVNLYQADSQPARRCFEESWHYFLQVRNNTYAKKLIYLIGISYWTEGRLQEAGHYFEQLADFDSLRREAEQEYTNVNYRLRSLADLVILQGELERAEQIIQDLIGWSQQRGDSLQLAISYLSLAGLELERGRPEAAYAYLQKARAQQGQIPDVEAEAWLLVEMSWHDLQEGDRAAVRTQACFALDISRVIGHFDNRHWTQYNTLQGICALALAEGQTAHAARLLGAAQVVEPAYYEQFAFRYQLRRRDELQAALRTALGEASYQQEYAAGSQLSPDEAVALAYEYLSGNFNS